jgi:riboflavin biosynthesis pyrimidine reductase
MIATADGRATIAGRTAPIANRADYELFHALRERAEAVLVGAGTVRVEGYGPMDQLAVVVTRTARVPADVGLLAAPANRVVVLTPSPEATLPPCAASVSYLRGTLGEGLRALRAEHGVRSVLCEGGPQLLGELLRGGLADELHLVIAPKLAAGPDPLTIVTGPGLDPPAELSLRSVHESGGYLFLRYGVGLLEWSE